MTAAAGPGAPSATSGERPRQPRTNGRGGASAPVAALATAEAGTFGDASGSYSGDTATAGAATAPAAAGSATTPPTSAPSTAAAPPSSPPPPPPPPPRGREGHSARPHWGGSVEFRPAGGLSPHQAEGGGDGGEGGRRFPEPLTPTFHKATRSPCGRGLVGTYWQDPRSYYCGPSVSSVLPQEKSSYCFLLPLGGRLNAWGDHWGDRTIVFRCVKGPWGIYQSGDA